MQHFFSLALFLLFINQSSVQAQTISYSEEVGELATQQLVDAKNCFFKNQESSSRIFKVNVVDLMNTRFNFSDEVRGLETGLGFGFEQKIKPGWSINSSFQWGMINGKFNPNNEEPNDLYADYDSQINGIELEIEPRWYFKKRKEMAEGKSGDNLSGSYLGLSVGMDREIYDTDFTIKNSLTPELLDYDLKYKSTSFFSVLNLGLQQQFLKSGYFDIKMGVGRYFNNTKYDNAIFDGIDYGDVVKDNMESKWMLNYELSLGFALDNNRKPKETPNCTVFEYHKHTNKLFKFGLINPYNLINAEVFIGTLFGGFEQKINAASFSINVGARYDFFFVLEGDIQSEFYWEIEPRYYYDLNKRQLAGKTGNSFSANYVGFRSSLRFTKSYGFAPVWGIQRQFFKNFLFDFKVGPELLFETEVSDRDWHLFSELRVGIAF